MVARVQIADENYMSPRSPNPIECLQLEELILAEGVLWVFCWLFLANQPVNMGDVPPEDTVRRPELAQRRCAHCWFK